jgi:tyrosinase
MSTTDETRLRELRARSEALFKTPYNQIAVRLEEDAARSSAQPAMRRDGNEQAIPTNATFNVFDIAHQETALDLSQALSMIAANQPGMNGLDAVLNAAEAAFATQNSDLVKFALGVFITNDPRGRTLYIPPAIEQSPELFIPSNVGVSPASPAMGGLGDEAKLDYFREDPDFNAHHLQWHRVYPTRGSLDPSNPGGGRIAKDRQGELFWYMHQQMLARYDTERIALDLPPVDALDDYTERLEGYRADENIADRYNGREPDQRIADVVFNLDGGSQLDIGDMEALRDGLLQAGRTGRFEVPGQPSIMITPDARGATLFGATLESSIGRVPLQDAVSRLGGLHNLGHGFFSALSPQDNGVMRDPAAAVRDPVFYRWHRHIDDVFAEWQEHLPPNDVGANAPTVLLRKDADGQSSDIGLALLRDLAPGVTNGTLFDGATFGAQRFGGANWDTPLAQFIGDGLTQTLLTSIGTYDVPLATGDQFPIFHLDHAEFAYFFRMENTVDAEQQVTVRVFLAAVERADDRRWWIEMDKFLHTLAPRERAVLYRPARLSSVALKPARRPQEPRAGAQGPNDDYCRCGWPYHMLLPRGREGDAGMQFRLLVMLTNAVDDLASAEGRCGSVSFCGSRDQKYPDNKLMGYPFDRPFHARTIAQTIADSAFPHLAALDFVIRHDPSGV